MSVKLSVIIVNYNVMHFLEQCLYAVKKAGKHIACEIFVVDNNSVDGSMAMVKSKFPEVHTILNDKNTGFSYANNQAIRQASGEYILLLNPDTVVEEDTFEKVIRFADAHPDAGGIGVKMLDGKGHFLPESKRGLPTPAVAFYKIFGLSKLFSGSRLFGRYHLGYLDKDKIHEVDVLSGAFMFLRKDTLNKTGLLDESFFMYGEDIDLSYRITLAGYKNYYFPETRIIHYKGESTKKSSVNYVFVFYHAMVIFAKKHFSQNNAQLFSLLINLAIYLRASIAIAGRFIRTISLPLFDAGIIFGGFLLIKNYYETHFKYQQGGSYPIEFTMYIVPGYITIWLTTVFFTGGYDKPVNLLRITRGVITGTMVLLIIYALLPEHYHFSRALTLAGAIWTLCSLLLTRFVFHLLKLKGFLLAGSEYKRIIVVGSETECKRVEGLLKQTTIKTEFIGFVNINDESDSFFLGTLKKLPEIIAVYRAHEVIFCAKDVSSQRVIDYMSLLDQHQVDFKIAPPESLSIIGSNSIDTSGDLYTIEINAIIKPVNKRSKRLLDISIAILLLLFFPIALFIIRNPLQLLINTLLILSGRYSLVGYSTQGISSSLPRLKKGILNPLDATVIKSITTETIERLNILYAKNYTFWSDIHILMKGVRNLGRKIG